MKFKQKLSIKKIWTHVAEIAVLLFILVLSLLPIFWGILTSIKPARVVAAYPPCIANFSISFEHYERIFQTGFVGNITMSIFYCIVSVTVGIVTGYLCAYAFHRSRFFGKKIFFYIVVAGIPLSVGSSALLIPNYIYLMKLGLNNHWYTMILIYTAYNLPMSIWVLRGGIEAVPIEIEEAATVDGCSKPRIILGMVPRFILPSIAASALFIFIGAWNEFIASSVLVDSPSLRPVQTAIYNYLGFFGQEWGPLTASATVAIIPILIVFTLLGKLMISGLTAGAVKE